MQLAKVDDMQLTVKNSILFILCQYKHAYNISINSCQ
jgi:hypothetical protein